MKQQIDPERADCVKLLPNALPDTDSLADHLVPPCLFEQLLPKDVQLSLGSTSASWELPKNLNIFTGALERRCRRKPLVLLIDEAHEVRAPILNDLLNVTQQVREEDQPLLLVLAGTPKLETRLNEARASFWEKNTTLAIDRLTADGARDALQQPLDKQGIPFDSDVLNESVGYAQHYPYFLQVLGKCLWEALVALGAVSVHAGVLEQAMAEFKKEQRIFYARRHRELRMHKVLKTAEVVAQAFDGKEHLTWERMAEVIQNSLQTDDERTEASIQEIFELGYIWCPPGEVHYAPGIPSLIGFVRSVRSADG